MLHWGEEQSPIWRKGQGGPRGQKYDICHHLSPISNIFLSLPSPPPTKFPFLGRGSPSPTASTAGGHIPHTPRAMPGQDWCHHQCTTGQAEPQTYPESHDRGIKGIVHQGSNARAECILNIPTFWVNAGREANQARRKDRYSQGPCSHCHGRKVLGLSSSSPPLQHWWDGTRQMFSGPSMHKSTLSLPVSHFWALAVLDPCSLGATGTLQQLKRCSCLNSLCSIFLFEEHAC